MKILLIAPAWVGDMVMMHALCRMLKLQHPEAVIDLVASPVTAPLAAMMPAVRRAHVLAVPHKKFGLLARWRLGRCLRGEAYDQSIVITRAWKAALVPFFARVKKRTGWLGEQRYGLLNDIRRLDKQALPTMVQRLCSLAVDAGHNIPADLPLPRWQVTAAQMQQALQSLDLVKDARPILVLCPGAEFGPAKMWPAAHFAVLAQEKIKAGWQVWLVGAPKDQQAAQQIQAGAPAVKNLTGKTRLLDAVYLIAAADAVVTNDSGLMHVAAALDRAIVALYGSSSPDFTPPLAQQAKVLRLSLECQPCFQRQCPLGHRRCLVDLTPAAVSAAVDAFAFQPA